MQPSHLRDPWLDTLRASAITMVAIHHIGAMFPDPQIFSGRHTGWGAWGVDLFFVLSGWLIGGLYWKEKQAFGKVALGNFWVRRWMRTTPPYFFGMLLAWFAVWIYRKEPFDLGYLLFIQNYYDVMPFFSISWSLCIEEHFYLVVPLFFYFIKKNPLWALLGLSALPLVMRLVEYPIESSGFGYAVTATHLKADGLLLGFTAAYLAQYHQSIFEKMKPGLVIIGVLSTIALNLDMTERLEYVLTPILVALMFLGLLVLAEGKSVWRVFHARWIFWLATISYSVYLTHALTIHGFGNIIYPKIQFLGVFSLVVEVVLIIAAGWVFYWIFERTSMILRARYAPKKAMPNAG